MEKNYTIGLDIGTNSVGWAVIDDEFNLVQGKKVIYDNGVKRKSRTNLWGVRLFDDGETAEERRIKRGARRRYKRRKERLNYLRGIFESEIAKVDDSFFIRLDESFYQPEDKKAMLFHYRDEKGVLQSKRIKNKEIFKYPLFKTEQEEKDYYEKFPTIYHLRDYLMNTDEKADLRWVYLALHHILKYRGHFTNQGQDFDLKNIDVADSLREVLEAFNYATPFKFDFSNVDQKKANEILKNQNISKSQKAYRLNELYKLTADDVYLPGNEDFVAEYENLTEKQKVKYIETKQKQIKDLFTAIVGNKVNPANIFNKKEYSEKENEDFPKEIRLGSESFDEIISTLEKFMEAEEIEVLLAGKKVYEAIVLSGILTKETLAASMVGKYESHKEQLKELKQFAKDISEEFYDKLFREEGVYTKFIEGTGNPAKKTTRDDFYKELKKAFETEFNGLVFPSGDKSFDWSDTSAKITNDQKTFFEKIQNDMLHENYLPKQRMSDNGAIPYQVHEYELIKIIENQGRHYPFLLEKAGDEYKIQTLMKFRIPYYVGPLTEAKNGEEGSKTSKKSQFAWMQKLKDEKITPWNFDEIVDKDASSIEFIERMTSHCTYLPDEKVLPKNSLLYQEFCVFNELVVSGYFEDVHGRKQKEYFGGELMKELVENLFKMKRKVTETDVINFLKNEKSIKADKLFGIDRLTVNGKPSFNNTMSTFIDLKNVGISPQVINDNVDMFDEIVKWQTIFTDKKSLKKRLEKANKEWGVLSKEQIDKLAKKHYTGFGNLSKRLINGIRDKNSGLTILETIKDGGRVNFMRLVSGATADRYTFKEQIEKAQTKDQTEKLTYDVVEQLAGSPAIKKGIWQSIQIIDELEHILGKENISKIVIEMSRGNEGGRTRSRYKQLEKIYKDYQEANQEVFNELKDFQNNEKALDNEKCYLYFMQNGKDAYDATKELKLDQLDMYEVDHIIPQCFLKDDSIDNKVLVNRISNQQKGGDVPSPKIVASMRETWESWAKGKLISQKKLKNLTTGKLTDKVREGFVNRQLVENRQITKHVANILAKYFEETETVVLTPKAGLTSQFRKGKVYFPNPNFGLDSKKLKVGENNDQRFLEERLHDGFPKIRDLNDYHHAHDAYLNSIVALYLYRRYPELKNAWVYGEYKRNASDVFGKWVSERKHKSLQLLSDMFNDFWEQTDPEKGNIVKPDTGEIVEFNRDEIIKKIEKTLDYKNINIVMKTERQIGKFGDESVYRKDSKAKNFSAGIKQNLSPDKYGGTKAPVAAFSVIVKKDNGDIKPVAIPSMVAKKYLEMEDKLSFLQELYPEEKIASIVLSEIDKYARFENTVDEKKVIRLMASPGEAQKGVSLTLSLDEVRGLVNGTEKTFSDIYDKISNYLKENVVYNNKHLTNWDESIKKEFDTLTNEEKKQFIFDALSLTKRGTTNARGLVKGKIGVASGQQQHKSANTDIIKKESVIIHQSVTGLYETRKTIE